MVSSTSSPRLREALRRARGEDVNSVNLYKITTANEYQYHLKDHLCNVRMTFTSAPAQAMTATFEAANQSKEQSQFLRYEDARLVNSVLFDHTHSPTLSHYSQRLNGTVNEKVGLEKSLAVMPGDTIKMEVYTKYVDPVQANWSTALTTLLQQVTAGQSGVVVDGASYLVNGNTAFPFAGM